MINWTVVCCIKCYSEEEETEVDENQCSGGAHENDGDDDCDGDGGDDSVNDEAMEIFQV